MKVYTSFYIQVYLKRRITDTKIIKQCCKYVCVNILNSKVIGILTGYGGQDDRESKGSDALYLFPFVMFSELSVLHYYISSFTTQNRFVFEPPCCLLLSTV